MDKILESLMNFINENTTLLIIICVFLIFVLIGYLIDNSIKTKKMAKKIYEEANSTDNIEPVVDAALSTVETVGTVEEPKVQEEVVSEPVIEPTPVEEIKVGEPKIDPNQEINLDFRTPEEIERDNNASLEIEKEEPIVREITVEPSVNDLLLRDFVNNGVETIDEEKEPVQEDITLNPIDNVVPIELSDSIKNDLEAKTEEKTSPYKNDKRISDIFKKKTDSVKEEPREVRLENTVDYSNELDRILQKLNDTSSDITDDSTLEETNEFSNMF